MMYKAADAVINPVKLDRVDIALTTFCQKCQKVLIALVNDYRFKR